MTNSTGRRRWLVGVLAAALIASLLALASPARAVFAYKMKDLGTWEAI